MRDDWGHLTCRSVSQHSTPDHMKHTDSNKIYLSIMPGPASEVTPSRLHVSQVSSVDLHFKQTSTGSLQSSSSMELGFTVAYLSPDRSTHRGPRDLSDPRHTFHQAVPDICAASRSSQKPSSISLPLYIRQHLSGISLVYLKFSTRHILLQMYPPDIQHTSKDISEHQGALIFFFEDLVRQALISVAHLFGFCARVPLEGQERTSQGKTFSSLWEVLLQIFR